MLTMRLLAFVVAVVALVGCSESVKGTEPDAPAECSAELSGTWSATGESTGSDIKDVRACVELSSKVALAIEVSGDLETVIVTDSDGYPLTIPFGSLSTDLGCVGGGHRAIETSNGLMTVFLSMNDREGIVSGHFNVALHKAPDAYKTNPDRVPDCISNYPLTFAR